MRPYPISGNSNRSCDRLSVSHPAHRAGLDFLAQNLHPVQILFPVQKI